MSITIHGKEYITVAERVIEIHKELKFASIDIVDISAMPKEMWLERLKEADVFFVEGGNTYHLAAFVFFVSWL
jgi:peptidase E